MVGAAADCRDGFAFQPELLRGETVEFHALDYSPAELVLLPAAPGVDAAGGGQR